VLQFNPPETFLRACFENFYEQLWLRDLKEEQDEIVSTLNEDPSEALEQRFLELRKTIQEVQERSAHAELELAEEAAQYRSAGMLPRRIAADPRGMSAAKPPASPSAAPASPPNAA
jgi:Fic family protein